MKLKVCENCRYLSTENSSLPCVDCRLFELWKEEKHENEFKIKAVKVCTFHHFNQWVNHAQSWLGGIRKYHKVICVDKNGNVLTIGLDFIVARDNDLFPVTAFRLIRTSEINERKENQK